MSEACRARQWADALVFADPESGDVESLFYLPLPVQVDCKRAPFPMLLVGGAAGVTKSHMARFFLYERALAIPGFEGLILRKTWPELEKHHLRLMEKEATQFKALGVPCEFLSTKREFRIYHDNGLTSILEGGHMENPEDVEKYLSRERDAIVPDEGSTFDPQKILELSTRARSTKPEVAAFARKIYGLRPHQKPPRGGAVFLVPSNPGGQASTMLRDFFIDHTPNEEDYPQLYEPDSTGRPMYRPEEWGMVKGDLEDNPYLPESYERDLAVLPPWRYQQLRWGNWDVISGQFFVEFDTRTHVRHIDCYGPNVTWFRSYDYGFQHPGCCLWWAILPDGRLHIAKNYKHQHLAIPIIANEFRRLTGELGVGRIRQTVADKFSMGSRTDDTSGETRQETFEYNGIPIETADHDRRQAWTRIHELFALRSDGFPTLTMEPECRYLIRSISDAVSDKNDPEDVSRNMDDHGLAALRFGAMSQPSPRILGLPPLPPHAVGRDLRALQHRHQRSKFAFR